MVNREYCVCEFDMVIVERNDDDEEKKTNKQLVTVDFIVYINLPNLTLGCEL